MYIYEIERPRQALKDFHPKGTIVTLKLDYGECILLDHALHEYEKTHPNITDEDRLFIPEPVKLETITNTKEINCNIDKIQNPFQNLKRTREDLFRKKLDWIKNLFSKE